MKKKLIITLAIVLFHVPCLAWEWDGDCDSDLRKTADYCLADCTSAKESRIDCIEWCNDFVEMCSDKECFTDSCLVEKCVKEGNKIEQCEKWLFTAI